MLINVGLRRMVGAIQRLFNSASFEAPLATSLALSRGTGAPTFTRSTTAYVSDYEGVMRQVLANEARFTGVRRVANLWGIQSSTLAVAASNTMTLPAGTYIFSMGIGTGTATFSGTGGATGTLAASASARTSVVKTITAGTLIVTASVATLTDLQIENITGRSDQTTPSEYVSVGVLSAPYHGTGVDGVKCFDTTLSGTPLPTRTTYDSVTLNGVAGTYVSTPDSVANSITGDIDIRVKATLVDWTPSAAMCLVDKFGGAGNRGYDLYVDPTGKLAFWISLDGTANTAYLSSVTSGIADGTTYFVRVTRASSTGDIKFYTSSDGTTWVQLGTTVASTAGTIFDSTSLLYLGARQGTAEPLNGKIYQAQIYNGINGTLAVDFDASRYNGGTTLTGSTGETWTLQGNAAIQPTNFPIKRYLAEGARTNLCLQSNTLSSGTWISTATATQDILAPDGTLTAWTLGDGTAAYLNKAQTITISNATVHTLSAYFKKVTGTPTSYSGLDANTGNSVNYTGVIVDAKNGTLVLQTGGSYVAPTSTKIEPVGDWGYRVSITWTSTGTTGQFFIYPAVSINGTTPDANATGTCGVCWFQYEAAPFASSYIPTTTAAVTRNADVLTYPSAGNVSGTAFTGYCEVISGAAKTSYSPILIIAKGATTDDSIDFSMPGAGASGPIFTVRNGATAQCDIIAANVHAANTTYKMAAVAQANDFREYLNGSAVGTPDTSGSMPAVTATTIHIGNRYDSNYADANIGNVRIWNRALSNSELRGITA